MAGAYLQLCAFNCTQQWAEDPATKPHCRLQAVCLLDSFCSSRPERRAPTYVGHKGAAPLQRKCSASLLSCNQWYVSKNSHHPENSPSELLLTACLAQISLTYLFCAILLIYRINRMHCKAITHLLCNETVLTVPG